MSVICEIEQLDEHEQEACNHRKGGILAAGILKTGHGITDFADATQWQAAIDAGKARIIKNIKATIPEPSAIEGENPIACGATTILDGFDVTVEWKDFTVGRQNDEFYRQLNSSAFKGLVLFFCQEDEIRVKEKSVNFVARYTSPESNKEKQQYIVTAKYTITANEWFSTLYDAPEGIFTE